MAELEKVLNGIEICLHPGSCRECPYYRVYDTTIEKCAKEMMQDALELLKKQQEQKFFVDSDGKITPLTMQKHGRWIDCDCGEWKCSACNDSWYLEVGDPEHNEMNYCPMCGAKMDEKGVECRCE